MSSWVSLMLVCFPFLLYLCFPVIFPCSIHCDASSSSCISADLPLSWLFIIQLQIICFLCCIHIFVPEFSSSVCENSAPVTSWEWAQHQKVPVHEGSNLEVVVGLLKARELIMPWEEQMGAPYERNYGDLSATCLEARWRAFTFPVNVGCMGLTGLSPQNSEPQQAVGSHSSLHSTTDSDRHQRLDRVHGRWAGSVTGSMPLTWGQCESSSRCCSFNPEVCVSDNAGAILEIY